MLSHEAHGRGITSDFSLFQSIPLFAYKHNTHFFGFGAPNQSNYFLRKRFKDSELESKMKLPVLSLLVVLTNLCLTLVPTVLAENHDGIQDNPNLRSARGRNDKECPDGFGGINCKDDIDECKGSTYPCAGG